MTTRRASYSAAGASDSNSGADWTTNVKKTIDGLNAAAAAGDTGLLPVTPEYDTGINATWPANGTAAIPVDSYSGQVALITDCISSSGWLANAAGDVALTYSTASIVKLGTGGKLRLTFDAAPQTNTLQAYCPIGGAGGIDLSAFQDLEFWLNVTAGTAPANSMVIKLCSDAAGTTPVDTLTVTDDITSNSFAQHPVCVRSGNNFGGGGNVKSIAIYTGAVAPGATSAWNFDAFYATNCHLTTGIGLCKVVKKPFKTVWTAGTVYGANATVQASWLHGGNVYWKTTAGGTSGGTEPLWKTALYPGETIVDGTVTWVSQGDNESCILMCIRSFNVAGLTFTLDASPAGTVAGTTGKGYYGTQETTDLYVIDPIRTTMVSASNTNVQSSSTVAGADGNPINLYGGASTADDSIVGITVFDGRNGYGVGLSIASRSWQTVRGIAFVRYNTGVSTAAIAGLDVAGIYATCCTAQAITFSSPHVNSKFYGITVSHSCTLDQSVITIGPYCQYQSWLILSSVYGGIRCQASFMTPLTFVDYFRVFNCGGGLWAYFATYTVSRLITASNTAGFGGISLYYFTHQLLDRVVINDAVEFPSSTSAANLPFSTNSVVYSRDHDNTPGNHMIFTYGTSYGQYTLATKLWTFYITDATRTTNVPVRIKVGEVLCDVADTAYTVTLAVTPSNAAIFGRLRILARSLPGIIEDQIATSSSTGLQTLTLTFTPTATGRIDVYLEIYVSSGTTHNLTWDEDSLSCVRNGLPTRVFAGVFAGGMPASLAMADADVYPVNAEVVTTKTAWGPGGTGYGPGEVTAEAHTDDEVVDTASVPGNYKVSELTNAKILDGTEWGIGGEGELIAQDAAFFMKMAPGQQIGH